MSDLEELAAAFAGQRIDLWSAAKLLKRQLRDCEPEQAFGQLAGLLPGEGLPMLALLALFKLHRSKLKARELGRVAREEALREAKRFLQQTCDELVEKEQLLQHVLGELDRSQSELAAQRASHDALFKELSQRLEAADGTITRLETLTSFPSPRAEESLRPPESAHREQSDDLYEELLGGRLRLEEAQAELADLQRRLQRLTDFLDDCRAFFRRRGSHTFERLAQTLLSLAAGSGFPAVEVGVVELQEDESFAGLLRERVDSLEGLVGSLLQEVEMSRQALAAAERQRSKVEVARPDTTDSDSDDHKPSREERKVNFFKKVLHLNIKSDD